MSSINIHIGDNSYIICKQVLSPSSYYISIKHMNPRGSLAVHEFIDEDNRLWVNVSRFGYSPQYQRAPEYIPKVKASINNMYGITFLTLEGRLGVWDLRNGTVEYFECPHPVVTLRTLAFLDTQGDAYEFDYNPLSSTKIQDGVKELLNFYSYQPTYLLEDGKFKCGDVIIDVGKIVQARFGMILNNQGQLFASKKNNPPSIILTDPEILDIGGYIGNECHTLLIYENGVKILNKKTCELSSLDTKKIRPKKFLDLSMNLLEDHLGDIYSYQVDLNTDLQCIDIKELILKKVSLPVKILKS